MTEARVSIGIDTGGTFTDCVLIRPGEEPVVVKVPSTPANPADAVLHGLARITEQADVEIAAVDFLGHGTTVATNAMLERRWARTGLITTQGFRDVLEIGIQVRPELYNLHQQKPEPIVPRDRRYEVRERLTHDGAVLDPLVEDDVRAAVRALAEQDVESIAIVFLFSYASRTHELRAKQIAQEEAPTAYVACSAEINPELREHPRTSTTVISAALAPVVRRYLKDVRDRLRDHEFGAPFYVMQSNGGLTIGADAEDSAQTLLLSGPAGGLIAAAATAREAGYPNVLTLDMGGTSCDVGIVSHGRPHLRYGTSVGGGHPLQIPLLDLHTIGAGGGSIGWSDQAGALKVGPRSAGAVPGPACYGHGGTEPTLTDANLFLGRLDADAFLGGEVALDAAAAEEALGTLANRLGLDVLRTAAGMIEVANTNMLGALRVVSTGRGHDPRDFALVCFGGAGPLHACAVAREMNIRTVIVPPRPGLFCAFGIIISDILRDYVQTHLARMDDLDFDDLGEVIDRLETRARERLEAERIPPDRRVVEHSVDLRYAGQEYYLNVPLEIPVTAARFARAVESFHERHDSSFGHSAPGEPVEIVNVRVVGRGVSERSALPPGVASTNGRGGGTRPVFFSGHGWVDTPWCWRDSLRTGDELTGPAVVEQMDSTLVIEPGQRAAVDGAGNILVEIEAVHGP